MLYACRHHHNGQCEILFNRHGRLFGVYAVHRGDRHLWTEGTGGESVAQRAPYTLQSLANAAIVIGVVIVLTLLLILLYKLGCYTIIWGWLIMSSMVLLSMLTYAYL